MRMYIKGTRFTIAQLVDELAKGFNLIQISEKFDLNEADLKEALSDTAFFLSNVEDYYRVITQAVDWSKEL